MSDPTRNQDKIEPGDVVEVHFDTTIPSLYGATVLYTPCAEGDSWRLREDDRITVAKLHYVQRFALMTLLKKAE